MSLEDWLAGPLRIVRGLAGRAEGASQDARAELSGAKSPGGRAALGSVRHDLPTHRQRALCRQLRHRRASKRCRAARGIWEEGIFGAGEELVRAALDRNPLVRRAALGALLAVEPERFAGAVMSLALAVAPVVLESDLDAVIEDSIRFESGQAERNQTGGDDGTG